MRQEMKPVLLAGGSEPPEPEKALYLGRVNGSYGSGWNGYGSGSINLSSFEGYQDWTTEDFLLVIVSVVHYTQSTGSNTGNAMSVSFSPTPSYNPANGVLTISYMGYHGRIDGTGALAYSYCNVDVYLNR